MFGPGTFNWHDDEALLGNVLVLSAAMCWSVSIVYTRAHRWSATPFQLIVWQTLIAAVILTAIAFVLEGSPRFVLSTSATAALLYNGAIGTALGFWAMTVVNKELPAVVTSLGVLATPVIGLMLSAIMLHESVDAVLISSSLLVLTGIAIGTSISR
jgi:drug/metabolite transporter (DMT)-like permease